ncbi:hypothetical protein D4S03_10120 [bacterium]|nr:MAG: hypothetical protein D4S03_10120 [bacterium]
MKKEPKMVMPDMFLSEQECNAVQQAIGIAELWGYGNLIDRIQAGWVLYLLLAYPERGIESALAGAWGYKARWSKKCSRDEVIGWLKNYTGERP